LLSRILAAVGLSLLAAPAFAQNFGVHTYAIS
jgi:hypothetical protein